MEQRSRKFLRTLAVFMIGISLAIITCVALKYLPTFKDMDLLAAPLIGAGVLYFGTSLSGGKQRNLVLEGTVAVVVIVMALVGQWTSPLIMALGYFLHGGWDYLHRWLRIGARIHANWFAELCLSYDWFMAVYIAVKYGYL